MRQIKLSGAKELSRSKLQKEYTRTARQVYSACSITPSQPFLRSSYNIKQYNLIKASICQWASNTRTMPSSFCRCVHSEQLKVNWHSNKRTRKRRRSDTLLFLQNAGCCAPVVCRSRNRIYTTHYST